MIEPDLPAFQAMTERAYAALPSEFREAAGRILIHTQDFAERDVLDDLGIASAWNLSGLYHGVALIHDSVSHPYPDTARIFLYRKPILAEWRSRGDVTLEELISHVVIHELGHHFGWSDEEMDALLEAEE